MGSLTFWVVLDEDGDFLCRLGQLVGGLLGGRLPEVDPVVLQDLVRTSKPDLNEKKKTILIQSSVQDQERIGNWWMLITRTSMTGGT